MLFGLSKGFRTTDSFLRKIFLGLLLKIFDVKTVNVEFIRSFLGVRGLVVDFLSLQKFHWRHYALLNVLLWKIIM